MGRRTPNPTIRILILGSPGVGKNCLESRFTTMTYPPPYDPALTLNSRRFFTLSPGLGSAARSPVTRPLDTSHGRGHLPEAGPADEGGERPRTASSTFSNPASEHRASVHGEPEPSSPSGGHAADGTSSLDSQTLVASSSSLSSDGCSECARQNNTYLVELINYPTLQQGKVRAHVHGKAEYDAVLLVYDVSSRASFEAVRALHAEIPVCTRKSHHHYYHHHRKAAASSSGDAGGGGGSGNSGARNRTSSWFGGATNETGATGSGEIVVGLVGNKNDFDAEYASVELGLDGPLLEKEAEIQETDVEERSLVHPLFRQSKVYDEDPLSPRSAADASGAAGKEAAVDPRRSVMSADNALLDPRRSVLSAKQSIKTVPTHGKKKAAKPQATRRDRTEDIEKWLRTGKAPSTEEGQDEDEDEEEEDAECTRIDTTDSGSTTAAKRQVSRFEGESLTRELMLQVPFYETSAKTGENVEEVFEAVIREVLKEMGREVNGPETAAKGKACRHRTGRGNCQKREAKEAAVATAATEKESGSKRKDAKERGRGKERDREADGAGDIQAAARGETELESELKGDKVQASVVEEAVDTDEAQEAPAPLKRVVRRRESMMGRMRKVFTRKQQQPQPAMVTDITA